MKITNIPVGMLQTNCYLVETEGKNALLIDPGAQPEKLLQILSARGLQLQKILLTHGHYDHIGAVTALREATGAKVFVHEADVEMIENPAYNFSVEISGEGFSCSTDEVLTDGEKISLDEVTFTVIHTPGHTKGGICFQTGSHLFTGDSLFAGGIGRTDLYAGSYPMLADSVKRLAALSGDFTIYPGHGGTSTLEQERRENPYLGGGQEY